MVTAADAAYATSWPRHPRQEQRIPTRRSTPTMDRYPPIRQRSPRCPPPSPTWAIGTRELGVRPGWSSPRHPIPRSACTTGYLPIEGYARVGLIEPLFRPSEKSNSPFFTPETKSAHSCLSNMSGSRVRSLVSRTMAPPSGRGATSTHPPELHRLLVRYISVGRNAMVTGFLPFHSVIQESRGDERHGLLSSHRHVNQVIEHLYESVDFPLLLKVNITQIALDIHEIVVLGLRES